MLDLVTTRRLAVDWCDAWNRRDLDAIMRHYADDVRLCSPKVVARCGIADGWVEGKDWLREYFAIGVQAPGLRFELVDVLLGVNALSIVYRREDGALVADLMELDVHGRGRRVVVCYGQAGELPEPSCPGASGRLQ
jgi:ketosteroid isomerase-like protein